MPGRGSLPGRGRSVVDPWSTSHSIVAMSWGTTESEPEVRDWLEKLPAPQLATPAFFIDLVAHRGPLLGEPYTRQLDGKLREPWFQLDGRVVRVTYWIASGGGSSC